MNRYGRHLVTVAAVLVVSGCGGQSSQNPFRAGAGGMRSSPHVEVTNNNWRDAVVYATRLGTRIRIGQVTSQSQRLLKIPMDFAGASGTVGLQVRLIGSSENFQTGELYVSANDIIFLEIQNHLATSSVAIFPR